MGLMRVTYSMAAIVWFIVIVLACIWWGWPAIAIAALFLLMPDVSLIGAFSGEKGKLKPERVRFYNLLHSMPTPIALLIVGVIVFIATGAYEGGVWQLALAGLAWFVHIAADRALGFNLRGEDGSILPMVL